MKKGIFYLIPTYLDESNERDFISPMVLEIIRNTSYFLVENIRTARRFISSLKLEVDISALNFHQLDKDSTLLTITEFVNLLPDGTHIGIMSEAGLPGLADPGHLAVNYAHQVGINVVPLPGASAIQTALICSGFNGQQFTFHGYIPIDKDLRKSFLRNLEEQVAKTGYTQLFMETPFRNNALMQELVTSCRGETWLSVASGLFGPHQFIETKKISVWKSSLPDLHKIPSVFSIGKL